MKKYFVTLETKFADLGIIGYADSLEKAVKLGRKALKEHLSNGGGFYCVFDSQTKEKPVKEENSISTKYKWIRFDYQT